MNADVLAVIEAEDRVALKMFSDHVLKRVNGVPYDFVMVIDGNDDRGIDVGLMTRAGFAIGDMRSHINDLNAQGNPIFSRDCPEYAITTPSGERIWVLPNHFKSKLVRRLQERDAAPQPLVRLAEAYERGMPDFLSAADND